MIRDLCCNSICVVGILLVMCVVAGATAPNKVQRGIEGSKHDLSGQSWTGGDSCVACHAETREELPADAPLWNPSADFNRTFSDALQSISGRRSSAGRASLVCMRCHDGTLAADVFGGLSAPRVANKRHSRLISTAHGGTNHPVGVEYPQFDREFRPISAILSEGKVLLPGGRVECMSCHDPHNQSGEKYMLVKSNHRSALCLTCHKK